MIIKCNSCPKFYDDQFRLTICPHNTFSANDGWNNFRHYSESWLADYEPRHGFSSPGFDHGKDSEHDLYNKFLNENRVKTEEKP